MRERTKGWIVLVVTAAGAIAFLQLRQEDAPSEASQPAPAPSTSAAPAVPSPRTATRTEIEQTIGRLEAMVGSGARDARSPWALAHGLLAFGKDLRADDERAAVDVIASFAEKRTLDGRQLYLFPERRSDELVEPHRHLLVKTLLDVGVPLDRELATADGSRVTLERLALDLRRAGRLPESDRDWHHAAWLLTALTLHEQRAPERTRTAQGLSRAELAPAALARLERDHQAVTAFTGAPAAAFDPGSPLRNAKEKKTGIYGHSCGGLHLVQAVIASNLVEPTDDGRRRIARQLGVLAFRYDAEREATRRLLAEHPEHGLILRVQELKFFGHLLETLMLARKLGAYRPGSEGGAKLDAIVRHAAADVADVTGELVRGGVAERLRQIRSEREQTYLDLVGDGCHAIHGLREALALYEK